MRRTLNYGANSRMDHLSLPLTESAADYFDKHAPFDYLDMDYATNLSREGCVDPCTLIVALVYLDRIRGNDRQHFETTDPADLYLAALIVASKFLHDDGSADFVYNDEWAASASTTLKHVNEQEISMLNGLNWNLLVSAEEFELALRSVETHLARKSLMTRGFATYSDLRVLARQLAETDFLWNQVFQPLLALFGFASLAYTATVFGLFGASLHLKGLPISTGLTSCDSQTRPIDLLPIAHSTISGLESLAILSFCPESLLNAHIRTISPDERIVIEPHQKITLEKRYRPLATNKTPPRPVAPEISSGPETKTDLQRRSDCWSCGLEVQGGCLQRNLTAAGQMGFA